MELTKQQIKYIDHRLENEGIKYWDIRIEMLDHLVLAVEKRLEISHNNYQFQELVQDAFVSLGWKENFNGGGLDHLRDTGTKIINNTYKKQFFKGFVDFFKKPQNRLVFIACFVCFFITSQIVSKRAFFIISSVIFILPIIFYLIQYYKVYKMKLGKSIHKDYALFYMTFSFLMLSFVFQFMKNDESIFTIPYQYHNSILLIIIPVHIVFCFSGFRVYKTAISTVKRMKNYLS